MYAIVDRRGPARTDLLDDEGGIARQPLPPSSTGGQGVSSWRKRPRRVELTPAAIAIAHDRVVARRVAPACAGVRSRFVFRLHRAAIEASSGSTFAHAPLTWPFAVDVSARACTVGGPVHSARCGKARSADEAEGARCLARAHAGWPSGSRAISDPREVRRCAGATRPFVREVRAERQDAGTQLATVYHLVPRHDVQCSMARQLQRTSRGLDLPRGGRRATSADRPRAAAWALCRSSRCTRPLQKTEAGRSGLAATERPHEPA